MLISSAQARAIGDRVAQAVLIDLSNNCIDHVGQNTIDDLESAAPVKIKLKLMDNKELRKNHNVIPENVTLELGHTANGGTSRIIRDEQKEE
jgi:hypothetical protein